MAEDLSKGKGKANASNSQRTDEDGSQRGGASSAAQSLASALRSTMASSQLGSLMQTASGGKAEFRSSVGSGADGELRDWLVQDLRSAPSGSSGLAAAAPGASGGFRTTLPQTSGQGSEQMFQDFERGLSLKTDGGDALREDWRPGQQPQALVSDKVDFDQAWPAVATHGFGTGDFLDRSNPSVIATHAQLDAPLHASVRASYAPSQLQPSADHFSQAPAAAQTDDIFALLDAEESADACPSAPIIDPAVAASTTAQLHPDADPALSKAVLEGFDPLYRPPFPSHPSFSGEQAAMHLSLAEAQASEQGQMELLVPRQDNADSQEGVYAPTAEQALASIFDGRQESSTVTEEKVKGEQRDRGSEVVRKITKYFGASTYLDDVYGIAPLLRETIEEVVREGEGDEEKKQKAVRRLEALWGHLSNTKPEKRQEGTAWVDGWLRSNT